MAQAQTRQTASMDVPDEGGEGGREPFAAFVIDDADRQMLRAVAENHGWSPGEVSRGDFRSAMRTLGIIEMPQLLIAEVPDKVDMTELTNAVAELSENGCNVLLFGEINDIGFYRTVIDAGARDYLIKPVAADTIEMAIERIRRKESGQADAEARRGRLIAVVGARGGAGATMVACNLAADIAAGKGRKTVLVDLDLQFGAAALTLDAEPGRGLREALEAPDRADELLIERAASRVSDSFYLLAAEEALEDPPQLPRRAVNEILDLVRAQFDYVVLDVPRALVAAEDNILPDMADIVLVSELTLPALRDANRIIRRIRTMTPQPRLHLVVNQVGRRDCGDLPKSDYANGSEEPVRYWLPADGKAIGKAAVVGKPLEECAKGCRLAKGIKALSTDVAGQAVLKRRRFSLGRLFK